MASEKIPARFRFTVAEAINPACAEINAQTTDWAEGLGLGTPTLRAEIIGSDVGDWAARALPRSAPEAVRLLSDFTFWFFVLDDEYCEKRRAGSDPGTLAEVLSRLIRVAEQPDTPILAGDPLADGLRDIMQRIKARTSTHYPIRFTHALRTFFLAIVWEAHHREHGAQACVEDYVLLRLHNAIMHAECMLLELGGREELTTAQRDAPAVRALVEMAIFVMLFDNDVASYDKERYEQDYSLTAITVLQAHRGLDLREAVAEVIAWRDLALTRFTEVRDHVAVDASPGLTDFLANLESMIRACIDWSVQAIRYMREHGAIRAQPEKESPASIGRLSFQATAWWWDPALTTEKVPS